MGSKTSERLTSRATDADKQRVTSRLSDDTRYTWHVLDGKPKWRNRHALQLQTEGILTLFSDTWNIINPKRSSVWMYTYAGQHTHDREQTHNINNKQWKNFDERPHRRGDVSLEKFNVIPNCFCDRPIGTLVDSMWGNSDVRATGNGARRCAGKSRRHLPQKRPSPKRTWTSI